MDGLSFFLAIKVPFVNFTTWKSKPFSQLVLKVVVPFFILLKFCLKLFRLFFIQTSTASNQTWGLSRLVWGTACDSVSAFTQLVVILQHLIWMKNRVLHEAICGSIFGAFKGVLLNPALSETSVYRRSFWHFHLRWVRRFDCVHALGRRGLMHLIPYYCHQSLKNCRRLCLLARCKACLILIWCHLSLLTQGC